MKVIRLKESDIQRIVKRTLNEQDYGDKETVKNTLLERIISEIVTTLDFTNQMGFDGKLTYSDIGEVLEGAFNQSEYLFMGDNDDGPDVEYGDEEDERRYDDRENYGTDDESRYDERNYKYGNHPDEDNI